MRLKGAPQLRKNWLRLTLALTSSACVYAATIWIYNATAPKGWVAEREPIAYVTQISNQAERRPLKRTIWQDLQNGQPVYAGEAIRTPANGEARLMFKGSNKTLDIESESMILLTSQNNEVALELIDGSVFVAQNDKTPELETAASASASGQASAPTLTLKSEKGKIDLSKATVALSKQGNQAVDVQVIKGSAVLNDKNGQSKTLELGQVTSLGDAANAPQHRSLQAISPRPDSPIYVSAQHPTPTRFAWAQLEPPTPPGTQYELWLGPQRRSLTLAQSTSSNSEINYTVFPGRYFWKIVAKEEGKKTIAESSLQRLEVKALAAPLTIQPLKNDLLTMETEGLPVDFQWSAPDRVESVTLEISKDLSFKDPLFTEKFDREKTATAKILPSGKYFWRVIAYYPVERENISSQVQPFEIWVKPPKVINITWQIPETIYYPLDPKAELKWQATEDPDIKKWRLRLAQSESILISNEPSDQRIEKELTDLHLATTLPKPGRWIASVEALDEKGQVLSKSEPRAFALEVLPLLAAPQIQPEKGDLLASPQGEIDIKWTGVEGLKSFQFVLKSTTGKELQRRKVTGKNVTLSDLMPGSYNVEITGYDEYGRTAQAPAQRQMTVPQNSGLSAPKLKRIQVK